MGAAALPAGVLPDTVVNIESQLILERLPQFVYTDTAPSLPVSPLIYTEAVYDSQPLLRLSVPTTVMPVRKPLLPTRC